MPRRPVDPRSGQQPAPEAAIDLTRTDEFSTLRSSQTERRSGIGRPPAQPPAQPRRGGGAGRSAVAAAGHDIDHLTALPGRSLLLKLVSRAVIADRLRGGLTAVFVMDLNDFSSFNDGFGQEAADAALSGVARALGARLPLGAVLGRIGGDEFAICVPSLPTPRTVETLAGAFRSAVAGVHVPPGAPPLGATVGIAVVRDGEDGAELLRQASLAMRRGKSERLPSALYDPAKDAARRGVSRRAAELRRAINAGELTLHYQPIVALCPSSTSQYAGRSLGELVAVEALVRWKHPKLGLVMPSDIIPLAENAGLDWPLFHWVLEEALQQTQSWTDRRQPVTVSVNVSPQLLRRPGLVEDVISSLDSLGVRSRALTLEVTEDAFVHDDAVAAAQQLSAAGVGLAIDDFGAGWSNLSSLKRLPITHLKLDRSFITNIAVDATDRAIAAAVTQVGRELGLTIVAEGVEDDLAREALCEISVDAGQGYLWSPGVDLRDFHAWLVTSHGPSLRV